MNCSSEAGQALFLGASVTENTVLSGRAKRPLNTQWYGIISSACSVPLCIPIIRLSAELGLFHNIFYPFSSSRNAAPHSLFCRSPGRGQCCRHYIHVINRRFVFQLPLQAQNQQRPSLDSFTGSNVPLYIPCVHVAFYASRCFIARSAEARPLLPSLGRN